MVYRRKPRTKVVVRNLPQLLTENDFIVAIRKFENTVDWISYVPGKIKQSKRLPSLAYINFKTEDAVYDFAEQFEGHIFVDKKGQQFKASVEYAPNPRVPKKKQNVDPRIGTIEQDPDYLKFVENMDKPVEKMASADAQLEKHEEEQRAILASGGTIHKIPPLLQALMAQKKKKREHGADGKKDRKGKKADRKEDHIEKKKEKQREKKKLQQQQKRLEAQGSAAPSPSPAPVHGTVTLLQKQKYQQPQQMSTAAPIAGSTPKLAPTSDSLQQLARAKNSAAFVPSAQFQLQQQPQQQQQPSNVSSKLSATSASYSPSKPITLSATSSSFVPQQSLQPLQPQQPQPPPTQQQAKPQGRKQSGRGREKGGGQIRTKEWLLRQNQLFQQQQKAENSSSTTNSNTGGS